ncbi:hypothetical protein [Paenalcaligenes suwonensis]|uniref:hypothetical protein n=1 Tax=Paenalcaligenes suwonensis TaxID=1202713 RepID=UPI00140DF9B4|nr:hypothetical protein [Paenalcaligenes suwonensis]NHC60096.1 hypothetical protein [Paenalcaligenes suwonensis]
MRHSPLLHTPLARLLMALIAVGSFGWTCITITEAILNMAPTEILELVAHKGIPAVFAASIITGVVGFLGPRVIRFVLAKRYLIILALTALILINPFLAATTVPAILLTFCLLRAVHSKIGTRLISILNFSDISLPRKVLYTLGGTLIIMAIPTTPRLSLDIGALLPWPLFSIVGLLTVVSVSIVLGYIAGNLYFPKVIHRNWAMLVFFFTILSINPVVGIFSVMHGLLLVLLDNTSERGANYVKNESKELDEPSIMNPIHHINPATGLPMVDNFHDILGNPYGFALHDP